MAIVQVRELIEAGVHFGSAVNRWNPKMKSYIHSRKNKICIIDLRETLRGLIRAYKFLSQITAQGKKVLFVGTKRQAGEVVRQEALRCNGFFVATRWLGGTLTNMKTMRQRIVRLKELEELETSGQFAQFSKKMISTLSREKKKVSRNFEGIRDMDKLPGAIVVVDPCGEDIAVAEAIKLDIPVVAITDTDSDPEYVDFVIPGNDDSMRSVQCLLSKLADAVCEGSKKAATQAIMDQRAGVRKDGAPKEAEVEVALPGDISKVGSFSYGGEEK